MTSYRCYATCHSSILLSCCRQRLFANQKAWSAEFPVLSRLKMGIDKYSYLYLACDTEPSFTSPAPSEHPDACEDPAQRMRLFGPVQLGSARTKLSAMASRRCGSSTWVSASSRGFQPAPGRLPTGRWLEGDQSLSLRAHQTIQSPNKRPVRHAQRRFDSVRRTLRCSVIRLSRMLTHWDRPAAPPRRRAFCVQAHRAVRQAHMQQRIVYYQHLSVNVDVCAALSANSPPRHQMEADLPPPMYGGGPSKSISQ